MRHSKEDIKKEDTKRRHYNEALKGDMKRTSKGITKRRH